MNSPELIYIGITSKEPFLFNDEGRNIFLRGNVQHPGLWPVAHYKRYSNPFRIPEILDDLLCITPRTRCKDHNVLYIMLLAACCCLPAFPCHSPANLPEIHPEKR